VDRETELTLIGRLRAGDQTALESLMEQYGSKLYRLAYGITRNTADAEEVVQDVFLTLFRKIDTFEGRAALGTWLYRVATNAALAKKRGQRAEREVPLESQLPKFLDNGRRAGDQTLLMADWSQNPEANLLSQETKVIVNQAVDALPEPYRAVLLLRDIEGLSNEAVAEILRESVAAVKSRVHRGRMAFREALTLQFGPRPSTVI
jgi:RNA polymerase sigma-70 factor (ECF subfamily)